MDVHEGLIYDEKKNDKKMIFSSLNLPSFLEKNNTRKKVASQPPETRFSRLASVYSFGEQFPGGLHQLLGLVSPWKKVCALCFFRESLEDWG